MANRPLRHRTGNPELDTRVADLLAATGARVDLDLLGDILVSAVKLAGDGADRLDLKITNAALKEMREAFKVFSPYRQVPKVTIFGSARTLPEDPLYGQARHLAAALAAAGWMVVTGAGPGIMAAGAEGAGRALSLGVNIRLPFEQGANAFIVADPKLVEMKYFFTRKLMLLKESAGFAVLPGGFGTLDEAFELLTLLQTGKAAPAPIVLVDVPGGSYWQAWDNFVRGEVTTRGLVSEEDLALYLVTDDVVAAANEILGFFRNYHSIRYVGDLLVMRLRRAPDPDELDHLNSRFASICLEGRIEATTALSTEIAGHDHIDLPRIAFRFDRMSHGRLRTLIDTVNRLGTAPPLASLPDPSSAVSAGIPPEAGPDGAPG